jgi:O-Antigen ligase
VSGPEIQFHIGKIVLFGMCLMGAVMVGLLLAGAPLLLVLFMFGLTWLFTLPYHSTLALALSVATFNSALILPGVPGRPLFWELAAGLGWSGFLVSVALRQAEPGVRTRLANNRMLFVGLIGYVLVLLMLIYYRGIGIKVFGVGSNSGQMGGRLYVQQLVCAIFPFLFLLRPPTERWITRLFIIQSALSVTFVLSDLAFSYSRGGLYYLLLFLELPGDGVNFEMQEMQFGMRRFQSLFLLSLGLLSILWVWRPLRDYANKSALWFLPLSGACFALGLLGGHRALVMLVVIALVVCLWAQRFFTIQRILIFLFLSAFGYLLLKVYVQELPLAAQRTLSPIPGMEVDRMAREDGDATMDGRSQLRRAGWIAAQDYMWLGRGFGKNPDTSLYFYRYDMAYYFVDNGIFFNGTIGLLVNTGVPGLFFFFVILAGGTVLMFRILGHIREVGAEDTFLRTSCVLAGLWAAQAGSFVFLHGDSEYALRTFALHASMLMACDWRIQVRKRAEQQESSVTTEEPPALPDALPVGA